MSVNLTPEGQLGFHRPYTQLVKRTLTVANPNDRPVMFKVKTTAPKQYCVRPNSGRIEPNERLEVQVLLQPMKEDPPSTAKCRDKFLVQSAVIPKERDTLLMAELWQIVEKEERDSIHEQKIRCVYLPPNEDDGSHSVAAASVNGVATTSHRAESSRSTAFHEDIDHDASPSTSAPMSNGDSFQAAASTMSHHYHDPSSALDDLADAAASGPLAGAAAVTAATAASLGLNSDTSTSTRAPAAAMEPDRTTTPTTGGPRTSDLEAELASARSEVQRLRAQLKEAQAGSQLRQRGPGATAHDNQPVIGRDTQLAPIEGVPVQMVFGIAFAVFLVTWLFF